MKLTIDTDSATLTHTDSSGTQTVDLYSKEAFEALSREWLKVGWNQKHVYTFSWFGRPIIQLPEDVMRIQEVIYRVKPEVVLETGVAHGGSLIFYASMFRAMGKGRVIGIDIEIRKHNRAAIEQHEFAPLITLIEGSSTDESIVAQAKSFIKPGERVLVILDSNHTKAHVLRELELYAPLVSAGSYIVATDGSMEILHNVPRGRPEWSHDNPKAAAVDFAASHPEFIIDPLPFPFNESQLTEHITHWPGAYLQRVG